MKSHFRFYIAFVVYTLLFLFYPGDTSLFSTFATQRALFAASPQHNKISPSYQIPELVGKFYPQVSAQGVYVVDKDSFSPIFEKNTRTKFLPASTTKILTALVAYDLFKPDEVVTVGRVVDEGQTMGLFAGEKITVENLLYGILIHSGNDAAYALADHYGRKEFVELMNKKAHSLHLVDSHFTNPAGLDDASQYTSPFDLALAGRELLKNNYLAKIVSIKEIIISDVDYKYFHTLTNVNKLLGELQGVGGLKTGQTEEAGENLVTFYKHDGHQFLIVLLKSEDRFEDTRTIVEWIGSNVKFETISL